MSVGMAASLIANAMELSFMSPSPPVAIVPRNPRIDRKFTRRRRTKSYTP